MAYASNPLSMAHLVKHVQNIADATTRGVARAMIEATELAYKEAVLNSKNNFGRTPGRTRTGQLTNNLYRGYDPKTGEGFVGERAPYGAIQEFGGTVTPKTAKNLWIKNYQVPGQFKRWTPTDFMNAMHKSNAFTIFHSKNSGRLIAAFLQTGSVSGKGGKRARGPAQTIALFTLVKKATIPSTPYVRPAVEKAVLAFSDMVANRIAEEVKE